MVHLFYYFAKCCFLCCCCACIVVDGKDIQLPHLWSVHDEVYDLRNLVYLRLVHRGRDFDYYMNFGMILNSILKKVLIV